jgi:hypothetical protein
MLTEDEFKLALPDKLKKSVNPALMAQINSTLSQPELFEAYRDNLVSYTKVMADGKFKVESYIDAVKYVTHKLMGCTNIEAYMKTFPVRYQTMVGQGVQAKDIASYVTAYNKGKLVNLIYEQTLIPSYVLNQDLYQRALNVQANLMMNAKSEKVRSDAANSLLVQLKQPEIKKIEMDIGIKTEGSALEALRKASEELAMRQQASIRAGTMDAQQAAHQKLDFVDADFTEVTP